MNLQAFWHVAVMGSWRRVVPDQTAMLKRCGLSPMIGVVGGRGPEFGGVGEVVVRHPSIRAFETPTLQKLWEWCARNPNDAVLYFHTKGVSKPGPGRRSWRKLMEHWVVERWQENLPLLDDHDAVGVNWYTTSPNWNGSTFFEGNFWMARADWISSLSQPIEHKQKLDFRFRRTRPANWNRIHAEHWLGSKPGIRVVSLACREAHLQKPSVCIKLLKECGHPEYAK